MTIFVTFMVMKRAPRYSVAEAKAHLSEMVRSAEEAPAVIHNRGRDVAVVLSISDYERLRERAGISPARKWLSEVAAWRQRTGGAELKAPAVKLKPKDVDFGAGKP